MTFVQDVVVFLDNIGMWDIVLPFIFIFTVVYAVLEKTKVLGVEADGSPKHRFNAMAAFVIAFFVLIAVDVLNIVSRFSQWMVILVLLAVCIAIIFSLFGFTDVRKTRYGKLFMPIAFFIFGIVVLYVLGWLEFFDISTLRRYEGLIIGVIVFFIIMWFILREPKKEEAAAEKPKPAPAPAPKKPAPGTIDLTKLAEELSPEARTEMMEKAKGLGKGGPIIFEELLNSLSDDTREEIEELLGGM